jgi:penicillin-binding protein 1A
MGPQTSYDYLTTRLGVTSLVPADCDYAPMALGQLTNGITTREMAQAFSSFVNYGIFTYARTYTLVTDSYGAVVLDNQPRTIVAFSPNTAHVITYMLQCAARWGTGYEA